MLVPRSFHFSALAMALASLACGGVSNDNLFDGTGGGGGEGNASSTGGGGPGSTVGGSGPGCSTNDDCIALGDACNQGACVQGACTVVELPDGALCNDGLFCTDGDVCQGGTCFPGAPKACASDDNPCHVGMCNDANDQCVVVAGNEGGPCDDGDVCTGEGVCSAGGCVAGPPMDCSAFDQPCKVGVCEPGQGCVAVPANEGAFCDDGKFCSLQDHCSSGTCVGGAVFACPAPADPCMVGACDDTTNSCISVPGNDGAACSDGSACTTAETCSAGVCKNGAPANEGLGCDDGTLCTQNDKCTSGLCLGQIGGFDVYFVEDFSDNSQAWTLGNEWQIGPAKASPAAVLNPDPDTDHSPTADDGVAGIAIGGNASTQLHPYTWLESPAFDANVNTPVILSFYRWLNSDYEPYMDNAIQVWNGSAWIEIWSSPQLFTEDSSWQFIEHDVTAHKNAAMRVRFGMTIGSGGVFEVSSWNIDDVLVAAGACQ